MKIDYDKIVGNKYKMLTVVSVFTIHNKKSASCICDCGNTIICMAYDLVRNHTTSCGCFKIKMCIDRSTKHGMSHHPLTPIYSAMIQRCTNPNDQRYSDYGGRGVGICDEWLNSNISFFNWAIENGWCKGLNIDRKDNDKGYSPENCRIIDVKTNQRNKRNNRLITYKNETKSLAEWCDILGLPYARINTRLNREKLTPEQAFERPSRYKPTPTK